MLGLIPEPRSLRPLQGSFELGGGGILRGPGVLGAAAALAAAWMSEALALRGRAARFEARPDSPGAAPPVLDFVLEPSLGAEDYVLEIGRAGLRIVASGHEGAVMAASTLRQLLLSEGPVLPCLRIDDGPRFAWRGLMLDCARNFFRVEFVERIIDLMALHKLNRFHWHLTDDQAWRLEIAAHPELLAHGSSRQDRRYGEPRLKGGSYTRDDARRVVAYAAERGIVVIPEIETPGHALSLLASHPELSCRGAAEGGAAFLPEDRYGIFEDVLCAGNDRVFELLGAIFDEVAEMFPGPWIHAGGDEVLKDRWSVCPECRRRMIEEGLRSPGGELEPELLQPWFANRVAELIARRGRRMIGWDEILGSEGGTSTLRSDAIVMSWRGPEGGLAAARRGHDAVMCPQAKACYLDHKHLDLPEEPGNIGVCTVEDSYAFDPVPEDFEGEAASRILGGQATLWTEYMYFARHVEYMAFPRLCALAEVFWSPRSARDFPSFERRLATHGGRLDLLGVTRYRGALSSRKADR